MTDVNSMVPSAVIPVLFEESNCLLPVFHSSPVPTKKFASTDIDKISEFASVPDAPRFVLPVTTSISALVNENPVMLARR